jgi:8-oxo-dGTP pyrophosphatase MutT (NUDIX family)
VSAFRVVGSTSIAQAGFLSISELRVDGPGDESFTRHVVHHPGAVVVVPVESDGASALLVRQFRAATGGEILEVPAGKRDVDGELPEVTAARELEEEIGRRPGRLVKLAEFFNTPGFCDEYTYLFAALDLTATAGPRATSAEEAAMTVQLIALADIERLIATRALVDAKSILGLLLTRALVAGSYSGMGT